MKRIGYIYPKIYELENIYQAMHNASKGKRNHKHVKRILEHEDYYARQIHIILKNKAYHPSKPIIKKIQDHSSGKERIIHKPNFYPDQIIHWALMQQIQPVIMRGMYRYSCGSVPKRGTTFAQNTIRRWIDSDPKYTKHCLKLDVKKFYPSIDNEILKQMLKRKIKDQDALWLIDMIIDTNQGQPIGYFTSQWFANFFLEGLDHYIKEELGCKYYVRYVDDLVILGNNKKKLHQARKGIEKYLNSINLQLKENWQVFRLDSRPLDFLGVRFYKTHTTLRRRNALRIRRRIRKIYKKGYLNETDAQAVISYWGWIKRTDSFKYYHKYISSFIPIKLARKVVKVNAKIRNNNQWGINPLGKYVAGL